MDCLTTDGTLKERNASRYCPLFVGHSLLKTGTGELVGSPSNEEKLYRDLTIQSFLAFNKLREETLLLPIRIKNLVSLKRKYPQNGVYFHFSPVVQVGELGRYSIFYLIRQSSASNPTPGGSDTC